MHAMQKRWPTIQRVYGQFQKENFICFRKRAVFINVNLNNKNGFIFLFFFDLFLIFVLFDFLNFKKFKINLIFKKFKLFSSF